MFCDGCLLLGLVVLPIVDYCVDLITCPWLVCVFFGLAVGWLTLVWLFSFVVSWLAVVWLFYLFYLRAFEAVIVYVCCFTIRLLCLGCYLLFDSDLVHFGAITYFWGLWAARRRCLCGVDFDCRCLTLLAVELLCCLGWLFVWLGLLFKLFIVF